MLCVFFWEWRIVFLELGGKFYRETSVLDVKYFCSNTVLSVLRSFLLRKPL
jgi:hypothetical protein